MNEKMLVKLQQFKEWEKENRRMDKKGLMDIKELPVYLQADVVVCGGGTAGVFAAVAAAKEGAAVLLVEALGGLGGSAVNGLVLPMMRVYMKEEPR